MKSLGAAFLVLTVAIGIVAMVFITLTFNDNRHSNYAKLEIYPNDKIAKDIRDYGHISVKEYVWHFENNDELRILKVMRFGGKDKESMYFHCDIESIKVSANKDPIWLTGCVSLEYHEGKLIRMRALDGLAVRKPI
jgi:hypothetical protein